MKTITNVDSFIAVSPYKSGLKILRDLLLEANLIETIKWGSPVYTFEGKNMVGLGSFKTYFGLWFFQGALLKDEAGKLINAQEGKTRALRQWRFKSLNEIDPSLVSKYIDESKKHQLAGNIIKPIKKPLIVPSELASALNKFNYPTSSKVTR